MKFRLFALTAAALFAGAAQAQTVSIVTTPTGSFSNSAGQAIAKVLNDKAGVRAIVQAQATTGFDEVNSGAANFNVSNSFDATFFATGKGEYEGQGAHKNMRYIGALIPYRVGMHVRADSNIRTMADLKGKRISSDFNAQKTIGRIIEAYLRTANLSYDDVVKVPTPNVVRQAQDFMAGKVDVLFFALGSALVKQAAANVGGLRVLPVPDDPGAAQRAEAVLPGSYILVVKPGKNLEGVSQPTRLIAFDMVMQTNQKLSDDIAYRVAKALHDNKKDLMAIFPPFGLFQPNHMAKPLQGVTMHPGAAKYYREIGLLK